MVTESTRDIAAALRRLRDKVAAAWVTDQLQSPGELPELLKEISKNGLTGFRDCDEEEVFRHAVMYGLIDEDAGEDR